MERFEPAAGRGSAAGASGAGTALLRRATVGAALLGVAAYLAVACLRIGHPFELEWMEGAFVDQVQRLVEGRPHYVAPSLEHTPYLYTPLYLEVCALVTRLIGPGFLALRLVSLSASLGVLVLLVAHVRRATGRLEAGLLAAGLFAAGYRTAGAWLDIGRNDSLFLLLLGAALFVLRFGRGARGDLAAAGLLFLSFLTKQTALLVALPFVLLRLVACRGARRFALGGVLLLLVLGSTLVGDLATDGWYSFYVFRLPLGHATEPGFAGRFFTHELLGGLGGLVVLALFLLVRLARSSRGRDQGWSREELRFQLASLAGTVGVAWLARVHTGSYDNALLPALLGLSLAGGGAWGELCAPRAPSGARGRRLATVALCALVLAQLARFAYDPRHQIPVAGDRYAGEMLLFDLRRVRGEVFVPYHGYLARLAGKRPSAHVMALEDVLRSGRPEGQALLEELRRAAAERRYDLVVVDGWWPPEHELYRGYVRAGAVVGDPRRLVPVTGLRTRPRSYLVPLPRAPGEREGDG